MTDAHILPWRACTLMLASVVLAASPSWSAAPEGRSLTDGRKAYEAICRHCHEVGVGPELRGRQLPPVYTNLFVRRGMRAMPSFPRSFIDDATLQQLGEFIQGSTMPPATVAVGPARGAQR